MLSRPSWGDASLMRYLNEATFSTATLAAGVVQQILVPNPKRWAVGFTVRTGVAVVTYVSNRPDPNIYGSNVTDRLIDNWWNIFTHGPQIQQEWYAFNAAGLEIGWWEVEMGAMENNDK